MSICLLSLSRNKALKDTILILFFVLCTLYACYVMPIFYHKEEKSKADVALHASN